MVGGWWCAGVGQFYFDLLVPGWSPTIGWSVAVGSWDSLLPSCLNKLWWNSDSWEDGRQWICRSLYIANENKRLNFSAHFSSYFLCNKTENKCQELSLKWIVISVFCDFCLFFISVLWFLFCDFCFVVSDFCFLISISSFFCFLISVFRFQFSVFWFLFSSQWLWKKINVLMLAFVCRSLYIGTPEFWRANSKQRFFLISEQSGFD